MAFFPVWVQPQQLIMCLKGFGHGGIWLWRVLSIRDNVTAGFYIIWKRFDPCWGLSMWSCLDALIPGWVCPQVLCSWGGVFVGFYSWGILSTSNLLRREYIFSQFHSTVNASENQNSTQNTGRHMVHQNCAYTYVNSPGNKVFYQAWYTVFQKFPQPWRTGNSMCKYLHLISRPRMCALQTVL